MNPTEFGQLHAAVLAIEAADFARPAALATIIRTRGSTFRHAGARMLVHADGDVVCALSGGCPQRDIVERARRAIAERRMQIARYGRDESLDVLIEMGCGGELDVMIEPLLAREDTRFMHALAGALQQRRGGWLATVFDESADTTARVRHLVHAGGPLYDDVGDAALAAQAASLASSAADGRAVCSAAGSATLLVEPFMPPPLLVLMGVNAVSRAVAQTAAGIGWNAILVTQAPDEPATGLPPGCEVRITTPALARDALPCDAQCALVAMTFNLEQDIAWLHALHDAPYGYVGAIGSRERSARLRAACGRARLFAPAGLDLGADGPGEIAIAIVAEVIAQRHARGAASLSREAL